MDERSERIARGFEVPILVAALLVTPVIAIEQSYVAEPWTTVAAVTNWLIWLAFLVEVVVRLAVVPDRRSWLRAHPIELAIVVLTPPFLPASLQALCVESIEVSVEGANASGQCRVVLSVARPPRRP